MLRKLFKDEAGFVVSAELAVILTLVVCAAVVGAVSIRDAIVTELHDVSEAVGALNQSYNYLGITSDANIANVAHPDHATCSGSGYNDDTDLCDCKGVSFQQVCGKDDPSNSGNAEGT
jgi:hypothetical protein